MYKKNPELAKINTQNVIFGIENVIFGLFM